MPKSITGNVYGDIKAIEYVGNKRYKCQCIKCGDISYKYSANLKGNLTCKKCGKGYKVDLTGKQFGYLTVKSYNKESKKWLCECKCGRTILVKSNNLKSGNTNSCGICKYKDAAQRQVVADTSPAQIKDGTGNARNKTGYTGIYYIKNRNKWRAEITFQKKKYYLGYYDRKQDAIEARKLAENRLHGDFFDWYEDFKKNKDKK